MGATNRSKSTMTSEQNNFAMRGCLEGHSNWVTAIATTNENPDMILSASRDKTVMVWQLTREDGAYGYPKKALRGHGHFVQDVLISSGGWDKLVKVWQLSNCKLRTNLIGHSGYINAVTVSPDGSLCASGGKDGVAMLWDLNEGKRLYSLPCEQGDIIHSLCFSPNRYWLCAATDNGIRIWDLEGKGIVDELKLDSVDMPTADIKSKALPVSCISLAWSADGDTLFAGYTDGMIRVWLVTTGHGAIY